MVANSSLQSNRSISNARTLQHPVANAFRSFQVALTPEDQYLKMQSVVDALIICLGITAVSILKRHGLGHKNLLRLQNSFSQFGVTQGTWRSMVDALAEQLAVHPALLPNACRALRDSTSSGLTSELKTLLTVRNHQAHGGHPRDKNEAELRVSSLRPILDRALSHAQFLADTPWILVESCSFRNRSNDFEVKARTVMGEHAEFDQNIFPSKVPLSDNTLYMLTPSGPIELYPLAINRYCKSCSRTALFYADRILKDGATQLKCFERGHDIFDPEITKELKLLAS